jgi:hypothetical protein
MFPFFLFGPRVPVLPGQMVDDVMNMRSRSGVEAVEKGDSGAEYGYGVHAELQTCIWHLRIVIMAQFRRLDTRVLGWEGLCVWGLVVVGKTHDYHGCCCCGSGVDGVRVQQERNSDEVVIVWVEV